MSVSVLYPCPGSGLSIDSGDFHKNKITKYNKKQHDSSNNYIFIKCQLIFISSKNIVLTKDFEKVLIFRWHLIRVIFLYWDNICRYWNVIVFSVLYLQLLDNSIIVIKTSHNQVCHPCHLHVNFENGMLTSLYWDKQKSYLIWDEIYPMNNLVNISYI